MLEMNFSSQCPTSCPRPTAMFSMITSRSGASNFFRPPKALNRAKPTASNGTMESRVR